MIPIPPIPTNNDFVDHLMLIITQVGEIRRRKGPLAPGDLEAYVLFTCSENSGRFIKPIPALWIFRS